MSIITDAEILELQNSSNYKDRMKAEYYQLKNRYLKLRTMMVKYDAGTLDFELSCPAELLRNQQSAMGTYLNCLEIRAQIEGVEL